MRFIHCLLYISGVLVGCSQSTNPGNARPSPNSAAATGTTASSAATAAPGEAVATVLGQQIKRDDCLSPSQGIGSVEVGTYSLVFRLLMDDFSKSQQLTLSQEEIDAFWKTLRTAAQRANPGQPTAEPVFDEIAVRGRLRQAQDKLTAADLPLLERLTLQSQVAGLERALERKSPADMAAYEHLLPLRLEAALYRKYGGKVVARQISLQAAGAMQKLAEEAQASGRLVFHDEALKRAFWKRLNDDLANPEVPPERVDFSLPAWMQGLAQLPPGNAANATPATTPPVVANSALVGDPGILASFTGVWSTKGELKPSESLPDGGQFTVREVTRPILRGRMILGHEQSAPDGRKSLWLMGWDAQRNVAPFWMFDSDGLLGGQWDLSWDPATNTATGRATDMPPGWTGRGTNRFPNRDTNLVDYLITDSSGKVLLDVHLEKKRRPDDTAAAVMTEWLQSIGKPDGLRELQVLDALIGTWDAVTVARPSAWTPQETRTTSVITRKWILNDRLVLDTSTHDNGDESLSLLGVDSQSRDYRTWWFNSAGHRSSARGRWDPGTRTFVFQTEPDAGRVTRSTVQLISPDQHEWQIKVTDAAGKVYYDATITTTRREAAGVERPAPTGAVTSDRLGWETPKTQGGFLAFAFTLDGRIIAGGTGAVDLTRLVGSSNP